MRPLPLSDFRARGYILEKKDFALSSGKYPGKIDPIDKGTWRSIVSLPDDVSIRTSDKYGFQIRRIWEHRCV